MLVLVLGVSPLRFVCAHPHTHLSTASRTAVTADASVRGLSEWKSSIDANAERRFQERRCESMGDCVLGTSEKFAYPRERKDKKSDLAWVLEMTILCSLMRIGEREWRGKAREERAKRKKTYDCRR